MKQISENKGYIKIGLGIDAGGTYTDAVIYDLDNNITICKAKALTTRWDFTVGIKEAIENLDGYYLPLIELVSLSTTLATNAIVENEGQKVGLLLMPPYGHDVTKNIAYHPKAIIQGQLEISGEEITPINPDEVKAITAQMIEKHHVTAFAVSGYAGSINPEHELNIKKIIQDETGLFVSCGHELSDTLNFQTRAVTAMLNARIIPRLASLLIDLEKVLDRYNISAPVVVVKVDGTLISADMAKRRPVETILSGPAASVAGARHLTGLDDAIVVDMGGTTTDTAAISEGLVRLNEHGSMVGGHRTHVKALDIRTVGLGGDSLILYEKGKFKIGPKRVAPVAWLGHYYPGTGAAIDFIEKNIKHYGGTTMTMQIIARTGENKSILLNPVEKKIISLLDQRPYSMDELVPLSGVLSEWTLPLQRLEENFMIQRCGLTLTDLLHIDGRFRKWDTKSSERYAGLYAFLAKRTIPELIDQLMDIGAPINFFLNKAVRQIKTNAIIPDNADVANAIGAITSQVVVHKKLAILHDGLGNFSIEGISGIPKFRSLDAADQFVQV